MAVRIVSTGGAARIVSTGGAQRITEVDLNNVTVVPFSAGDTRAAIQSAIDSVAAAGGGIVQLEAGRVYEVSQTGNAATFRSTTPIGYGVVMKAAVILDGNGSTIKELPGQNCFVIINEAITTNVGAGTTQRDVGMGIINLVVDGNRANQNGFEDLGATPSYSEQGGIALQSVDRMLINNLEVNDCQAYGVKIVDAFDCQFDELRSKNVRGDVYALGLQQEGAVPLELVSCNVGNGTIEGAEDGYSFPDSARASLQGNGLICCPVNSTFGDWTTTNCGGGIKIENQSLNSSFDSLIFVGGANDTTNSGVKIQGFAGGRPDGITIGRVVGKSTFAEAMRFTACDNCHVASLSTANCATDTGFNQEVFFEDAFGCSVGDYKSVNSNADSTLVQVQGDSTRIQFGQIYADGHTVDIFALNTAGTIQIGSLISIGGNSRILNFNAAGSIIRVNSLMTSQASFSPDATGGTITTATTDLNIS